MVITQTSLRGTGATNIFRPRSCAGSFEVRSMQLASTRSTSTLKLVHNVEINSPSLRQQRRLGTSEREGKMPVSHSFSNKGSCCVKPSKQDYVRGGRNGTKCGGARMRFVAKRIPRER